jgi:hypothetical protein
MFKIEKLLTNKLLLKRLMIFCCFAENVKRQSKNNLFNNDNNRTDNHSHFMEQAFNKPYPTKPINKGT